jgi:hypothetical protein
MPNTEELSDQTKIGSVDGPQRMRSDSALHLQVAALLLAQLISTWTVLSTEVILLES